MELNELAKNLECEQDGVDLECEENDEDYVEIPVKNDNVFITKTKLEKKYCVFGFEDDDISYVCWNNIDNMLKNIGYRILHFGYDDEEYKVSCIIHQDLIRVAVISDCDRTPHWIITGIHTDEDLKKVVDMVDSIAGTCICGSWKKIEFQTGKPNSKLQSIKIPTFTPTAPTTSTYDPSSYEPHSYEAEPDAYYVFDRGM